MKKLFLLAGYTAILLACASDPIKEASPLLKGHGDDVQASSPAEERIIHLERRFGECMGQCPVYSVSIFASGKFIYEGKENVPALGIVNGTISSSELERVRDLFRSSNFFALKDRYVRKENCSDPVLSDSPYVTLAFRDGDAQKEIEHDQGCFQTTKSSDPVYSDLDKLYRLQKSIDSLSGIKELIERPRPGSKKSGLKS